MTRRIAVYVTAQDHRLLLHARRPAALARRQRENALWQADQARLQVPLASRAAKLPSHQCAHSL